MNTRINCSECKTRARWNGVLSHTRTCSRIDLESARWYAASSGEQIENFRNHAMAFNQAAQRWEGKFRIVCHENNQLRNKIAGQRFSELERLSRMSNDEEPEVL